MTTKALAAPKAAARWTRATSRTTGLGATLSLFRLGAVALSTCLFMSTAQAKLGEPQVLALLNTPVLSPEIPGKPRYVQERSWFEHAEAALRLGQRQKYRALKSRLQDYPLYPYLELQELQTRFHQVNAIEVEAQLQAHAGVPLANTVKLRWLHELGRRGDWHGLLAKLPANAGPRLECLGLQARLAGGDNQAVADAMPSLWLTGVSLPDQCDPVIGAWRKSGGLTADLAWQRTVLAIQADNPSLARYLTGLLPAELASAAERLQAVHRSPRQLENSRAFDQALPRVSEIVTHGLVRYSRREPEKAARLWSDYRRALLFTPAQIATINRNLGLMLAVRYVPESTGLLAEASASGGDANLHEWQARVHLRNGDWQAVADTVTGFPEALQETSRWQYWLARAEESMGTHDSAQARYAEAALERNFYGFLAADRLGSPYRLNHQAQAFSPEELAKIRELPAVERAYEFYQMNRLHEARREWQGLLGKLEHDQIMLASHLAQSWGWHEQGVMGAIAAQQWDDLQIRFPLAHQELFTNHALLQQLDVNWVYALARQESAFMADARSPAGALGLLQLLPGTARQTARNSGLPFADSRQLLDPASNIQLGTAHLGELMARFGNNRILATAAYNAGAHRVEQWLKEGADRMDVDVWIETMPYYETRQYVQNVLAFTVIYGFRRGEPPAHLLTDRELACFCLPTTLAGQDSPAQP